MQERSNLHVFTWFLEIFYRILFGELLCCGWSWRAWKPWMSLEAMDVLECEWRSMDGLGTHGELAY